MSTRTFSSKSKQQKVQSKPVALIIYEGKFNKTESNYFTSLNRICDKYTIKSFSTEKTDPSGLLNAIEKKWEEQGLSEEFGDKAFIVLDLDNDSYKANRIKELMEKSSNAVFVVSNPCIEVWFLNHFPYSTKPYSSSHAVKKELALQIPGYKENMRVFDLLRNDLETAIENSKKQIAYGESCGYEWPSKDFNPRTDMGSLIEELLYNEDRE